MMHAVPKPRRLYAQALLGLAGIAGMGIASRIEIPMVPVPVTMQTFAVAVIAVLFGWRLSFITLAAWLLLGAASLPLFAGGASGWDHLTGATAGYLIAFPLAALVMGWLAERRGEASFGRLFGIILLGHGLCLALGGAWLATRIGAEQAMWGGVVPFLVGAFLKSLLAAGLIKAVLTGARRGEAAKRRSQGRPGNP